MTSKNHVILSAVAVVLGGVAYWTTAGKKMKTPSVVGKKILPAFAVSDVARVEIGGAKKVALTADPGAGGGWLLRLANDGTPFDPATAPGPAEGHFGLEGMRQRARRLGATLSFAQRDGWTVLSLEKTEP